MQKFLLEGRILWRRHWSLLCTKDWTTMPFLFDWALGRSGCASRMILTHGSKVVPGDLLGDFSPSIALGHGSYLAENKIYSSVAGIFSFDGNRVCVSRTGLLAGVVVPTTNSLVLAKVRRMRYFWNWYVLICIITYKIMSINTRSARASIISVGDQPVMDPFPSIIRWCMILYWYSCHQFDAWVMYCRAQDVRSENIDSVQIANCFRPGDIVRALVISLGDSRSYFLTTGIFTFFKPTQILRLNICFPQHDRILVWFMLLRTVSQWRLLIPRACVPWIQTS